MRTTAGPLQGRRGASRKLKAVSDLLKTELPLAAGVCVFAGEVLGLGRLPSLGEGILGFLVGFLLSGSAKISNDYFDLEVDRINHPERPLPSGRISVRELALLTTLFSLGGLIAAAFLGTPALILAVAIWAVGLLYNWRLKEAGVAGNAAVAFSVASTFVFGGLAVGGLTSGLVWTFGALAFLFDLGEEIAGGVMDAEGDALRSARSLARVRGRKVALAATGGLFGTFVAVSIVPFLFGWMGTIAFLVLLGADAAVVFLYVQLIRMTTPQEGRKRIRDLYLTVLLVVAVFIISAIVWAGVRLEASARTTSAFTSLGGSPGLPSITVPRILGLASP